MDISLTPSPGVGGFRARARVAGRFGTASGTGSTHHDAAREALDGLSAAGLLAPAPTVYALRAGESLVKLVGGRSRRVLVTGVTRDTCTVQLARAEDGARVLLLGENGLPDGYVRASVPAGGGR